MKRTIDEVLNLKTGKIIKSENFFRRSEKSIFVLRRALEATFRKDQNFLVCPLCYQPVYISGTPNQNYTFKHRHELGDCPIKTKGKYSQEEIDKMRYNGVKESKPHFLLKSFIKDTLDFDDRFSEVAAEKVLKGGGLAKEWRKPDVSCVYQGLSLVWEIQLSTTYLNVIVGREIFYENRGTYILWLFNKFDPSWQRFTEKDIFWTNKTNAFVVDKRTMSLSREKNELVLCCHYREPYLNGAKVHYRWRKEDITVGQLKFDPNSFKAFYFDSDRAEERLADDIRQAEIDEFEQYWLTRSRERDEHKDSDQHYCGILSKYLSTPIEKIDNPLASILKGLYSAKHGRVIGYDFPNLLGLANLILQQRKQYTKVFTWALQIYGQREAILAADEKNGSFKKKVEAYKQGIQSKAPEYIQERKHNELFSLLFPEIADHL